MKKALSLVLAAFFLVALFAIPAFAAGSGALALTGAQGGRGETVSLNVNLDSNPGLITMKFAIEWDKDLELISVSDAGLLKGWTEPAPSLNSPYTLRWADSLSVENNTATGKIATLTFKISEDATPGEKNVTLISTQSWDANGGKNTIEGAKAVVVVNCPGHEYDNGCDADCNLCGDIRETAGHVYDDDCDATCNNCSDVREAPHVFDGFLDAECNNCGHVREISYDASGVTGDLTWYVKDNHLTITGTGAMPNYSKFGPWGTAITSATIEPGATNISNRAFYFCTLLESIQIPDTVETIGATAFAYCYKLSQINLPDGITSIGNLAFRQCSSIKSIELPESLTTLGVSAFYYCTSIESVTIGNSLPVIGQQAFAYCFALKSVTIPGSVTKIGASAFRDCYSLTTVVMEDSVKIIEAGAFYNCNALADLCYEGEAADFAKIVIKPSNTALTSAEFHPDFCLKNNSVHTYDGETDADCNDCGRVRYDTYGTEAGLFWYVVDGHLVICGEGEMPDYTKFGPWGTLIKSAEIKEGVTTIGSRAFYFCTSLESIQLPESLTAIGANSFNYCAKLKELDLPNGIKTIGNLAFRQCSSLKKVEIPSSMNRIGTSLFYYCIGLEEVVIPDSVKAIDQLAFAYCYSLREVTIPGSVTEIGQLVFRDCTSLTEIVFPNTVKLIPAGVFYNCPSITDVWYTGSESALAAITIKPSNDSFKNATKHYNYCVANDGEHIFSDSHDAICDSCGTNRIEACGKIGDLDWFVIDSVLTIYGNGTMEDFTSASPAPWGSAIKSVVIEEGVTSIGSRAFVYNTNLKSVTLASSVNFVGMTAFYGCTALTDVYYEGTEADFAKITIKAANTALTGANIHYVA